MDYRVINHALVAALIHKGEITSARQAKEAVAYALKVCGYAPWGKMHIDLFCAGGEGLLVASPSGEQGAEARFFPELQEYFTE